MWENNFLLLQATKFVETRYSSYRKPSPSGWALRAPPGLCVVLKDTPRTLGAHERWPRYGVL